MGNVLAVVSRHYEGLSKRGEVGRERGRETDKERQGQRESQSDRLTDKGNRAHSFSGQESRSY